MSKSQLRTADRGAGAFKGELRVSTGGGALRAERALSALTVVLSLVSRQSARHRPGCFQYS